MEIKFEAPRIHVFFDTEFTDLRTDAGLISIGLITEDGTHDFYSELSGTYRIADCSDFVQEAVLPQLEGGKAALTILQLGDRLADWIEALGGPVVLVTDSLSWDWPWIQKIFEKLDAWPSNLDRRPFVLQQDELFNAAVEIAFESGLRRHHALDDAKANRLAWQRCK